MRHAKKVSKRAGAHLKSLGQTDIYVLSSQARFVEVMIFPLTEDPVSKFVLQNHSSVTKHWFLEISQKRSAAKPTDRSILGRHRNRYFSPWGNLTKVALKASQSRHFLAIINPLVSSGVATFELAADTGLPSITLLAHASAVSQNVCVQSADLVLDNILLPFDSSKPKDLSNLAWSQQNRTLVPLQSSRKSGTM